MFPLIKICNKSRCYNLYCRELCLYCISCCRYRLRNKKLGTRITSAPTSASLTAKEKVALAEMKKITDKKINQNGIPNSVHLEPAVQKTDETDR